MEPREDAVENQEPIGYSRILLGTDGSRCSERAARHAVYLAEKLGAELVALNAVDVDLAFRTTGIHFGEAVAELEKAGREALAVVGKIAEEKGIGCEQILLRGKPHEAIVETSDEIGADLVIVGSTGMSSLERALVGSHSEKVLRCSKRPVLLVRDP